MLRLLFTLSLLCTASARAGDVRHWGMSFDVGAPDVVNLGVAWRPVDPLRLNLAVGTNGIGPGGRIGLALKVPWDVGPVLAAEAGHFLESDAR